MLERQNKQESQVSEEEKSKNTIEESKTKNTKPDPKSELSEKDLERAAGGMRKAGGEHIE